MTAKDLRRKYLKFFKKKGHALIPSASLIPENDPTVLFTTAGMHPLVLYLLGEKHPAGARLCGFQKCIRTGDIDEVGDQWHLTFFEMLGNWSFNDYWKKEAIAYSFEFLTKELKIPVEKLAVTVFVGDADAPFDAESFNHWQKAGIPKERIYKYDKKDNWWGPAGQTGPCGPSSEMFFITDKAACCPDCQPSCSCGKYVEIWNDVFMEYNKMSDGKYAPLKQKNVDTGMGVERTVAVLNNLSDNYHGAHIWPIVRKVEELSSKKYDDYKKEFRIIVDHLRAATFILGDEKGIAPSNLDQGYILRRFIRRAVRYGRQLGIKDAFTSKIAEVVIEQMKKVYPELKKSQDFIVNQLIQEEEKFAKTLERGLSAFRNVSARIHSSGSERISGEMAFDLFQSYGFPIEMTIELAREQGLSVDERGFDEEFKKHQDLSRSGAEKKFKGGLADTSDATKKLHTAAHLMQAALRQVLGDHVVQKGANITAERLRFDFSHPQKMTPEEIKKVEDLVNEKIQENIPVVCAEMTVVDAKKQGAMGAFESKYGDKVKVYSLGDFSKEICGGPHASRTGELGKFKIIKEEASSAGVRRIKAVLE